MHVASQEDPGPDSAEFHNHVYCEHGNLTLNSTNRRKMSAEVIILLPSHDLFLKEFQGIDLLKKLFPQWEPLSTDIDICAVCEAEISLSREDKREVRRRVEDEKVKLRIFNLCFSKSHFLGTFEIHSGTNMGQSRRTEFLRCSVHSVRQELETMDLQSSGTTTARKH